MLNLFQQLLYYAIFWHKAWKWNLIRKINPSLTTLEI